MTDEVIIEPTEASAVNRRVALPPGAMDELRKAFGIAGEARRVADMLLRQTILAVGIDPEHVVGLDVETGEVVLDEVDEELLHSRIREVLDGEGEGGP